MEKPGRSEPLAPPLVPGASIGHVDINYWVVESPCVLGEEGMRTTVGQDALKCTYVLHLAIQCRGRGGELQWEKEK